MAINKVEDWIWYGGKERAPGGRTYDEIQKGYNDWACNCACGLSFVGVDGREEYDYCTVHDLFGVEP